MCTIIMYFVIKCAGSFVTKLITYIWYTLLMTITLPFPTLLSLNNVAPGNPLYVDITL